MAKTKHRLFLDANVYLRFYKLSDSDIKELNYLVTLVKSGEVKLFLTEQVRDEFNRNREDAIQESIKGIEDKALKAGSPEFDQPHGEPGGGRDESHDPTPPSRADHPNAPPREEEGRAQRREEARREGMAGSRTR